jgi:hypothetical protein
MKTKTEMPDIMHKRASHFIQRKKCFDKGLICRISRCQQFRNIHRLQLLDCFCALLSRDIRELLKSLNICFDEFVVVPGCGVSVKPPAKRRKQKKPKRGINIRFEKAKIVKSLEHDKLIELGSSARLGCIVEDLQKRDPSRQ